MVPLSILKRQCGECRACCTVVGVAELGKPPNFACEHLCERGCGVYGKHPESCQTYKCAWLEGILDFSDRPDRVGVVFHAHEEDGFWLDGHLLPGAKIERVMSACYAMLMMFPWLRLVLPDQIMNSAYPINLAKYPGGGVDGDGGTTWLSSDGRIYILDAPARIT